MIYQNRKLVNNERFFKYDGVDNRTGKNTRGLQKLNTPSEEILRQKLAIKTEWGIKLDYVSEFEVPSGSWVSEGKAAAQGINYPGGDYQAVILNTPKSWIIKTEMAFK